MKCPRCSYEWDVRQSPCPRCSLHVRAPSLQVLANSQVSMGTPPLNHFVSSSPPGDKTAQVQSRYLREPVSDALGQSPSPSPIRKKLQLSRFPTPATEELSPQRPIPSTEELSLRRPNSPSLDGSYVLSPQQTPSTSGVSFSGVQADVSLLLSGTLIHRGRYSLRSELHKQEWPLGVVEIIWAAFDVRVAMSPVLIYELSIPNDAPKDVQDIPYTATKVFTSIGRNAHILPLRDVFSEKGHSFFVFESFTGTSLLTLMLNSGRNLPEKEVVACCLQIVELLEACARQSPPLIHGNIRPECIVKKSIDSQYVLTSFSVALAGGLAQMVADTENLSHASHVANTQMRGKMDVRTDLYALLAMAHYAIRGYWLSGMETSTIPPQVVGSDLSPQLRAIFLKGLRAPLHQRYQRPSELYQDLLVLQREYERASSSLGSAVTEQSMLSLSPMMHAPRGRSTDLDIPFHPRENPPEQPLSELVLEEPLLLKNDHDMRNAILWFAGMLLCLLLLLGPNLL